jgi:hypothetical protein
LKTLLLLATLALSLNAAAQIPSNGLVAYYPFSGNANDASGSGVNGSPATGYISANTPPTLTTDRNGNANSAYEFVPAPLSTSYIDLDTPAQLMISGSFSVSLWFNFVDYNVSPVMIASGGSNGISGYQFSLQNLSGYSHVQFILGGASSAAQFSSINTVSDSTWIHGVAVYDAAANTMEVYVDGVAQTPLPPTLGCGTVSGNTVNTSGCSLDLSPAYKNQIGLDGGFPTTNFKGSIDEVLIYNRALTAAEVTNIFNATGGPNAINNLNINRGFTVSPNPVSNVCRIQVDNALVGSTLDVVDVTGKVILQKNNLGSSEYIDLSSMANGVYVIKLTAANAAYTRKITLTK